MTRPNCPHCGQPLEYDYQESEYYDTENGEDVFFVVWNGYCDPCNRDFQWREHYVLTTIDGLKEVGE